MPQIKKQVIQAVEVAQNSMNSIDMESVSNKVQQTIQTVKRKVENLKKSSRDNEIAIKVNSKEAQKQISQIQKKIDSLQEKINARQMKLNIISPRLDKITQNTTLAIAAKMVRTATFPPITKSKEVVSSGMEKCIWCTWNNLATKSATNADTAQGIIAEYCMIPTLTTSIAKTAAATGVPNRQEKHALIPHMEKMCIALASAFIQRPIC